MRTWLNLLDNPDWHGEEHHNDELVPLLAEVHALLRAQRYLEALGRALHLLHWTMSDRQEALLLYVMARAAMLARDYPMVENALERALDTTSARADRGATALILALRAQALRNDGCYTGALMAYSRCLDLLFEIGEQDTRRSRDSARSADAELELDSLIGLAIIHFSRGRHELCESLLDRADRLLTRTRAAPELSPELGQILWMKALSARWQDQPWRALDLVEAAIKVFQGARGTAAVGRVFAVSAEIALDCLDSPQLEPAYRLRHGESGLLATAERQAQLSFEICRQCGDTLGQELAKLAVVRHSRLTGRNENRLPVLEGIVDSARQCDDVPLLIQACSALADEMAYLERPTGALMLYRHTIHIADNSEMPVMGQRARQVLSGIPEGQA